MSCDDLVKALASSLGQDKARTAVEGALRKLGLPLAAEFTREEATEVLREVGREGGLVAAAAKIAGLRLDTLPV